MKKRVTRVAIAPLQPVPGHTENPILGAF